MPPIVNHACYIDTEDANRYRSCGACLDVTLYDYLTKNAAQYPQREALIEPLNKEDYLGVVPRRFNWCELQAAVDTAQAEFPDVVELAFGGIFDAHFGERLCIYVVLRENTTTSLSWVCSFPEARGLAKTK
jgi:non-ribosomal peptide synthetase component E (peptide arylation enzyme)